MFLVACLIVFVALLYDCAKQLRVFRNYERVGYKVDLKELRKVVESLQRSSPTESRFRNSKPDVMVFINGNFSPSLRDRLIGNTIYEVIIVKYLYDSETALANGFLFFPTDHFLYTVLKPVEISSELSIPLNPTLFDSRKQGKKSGDLLPSTQFEVDDLTSLLRDCEPWLQDDE